MRTMNRDPELCSRFLKRIIPEKPLCTLGSLTNSGGNREHRLLTLHAYVTCELVLLSYPVLGGEFRNTALAGEISISLSLVLSLSFSLFTGWVHWCGDGSRGRGFPSLVRGFIFLFSALGRRGPLCLFPPVLTRTTENEGRTRSTTNVLSLLNLLSTSAPEPHKESRGTLRIL